MRFYDYRTKKERRIPADHARILAKLGKGEIVTGEKPKEPQKEEVNEPDEKDQIIAELAEYGIERDRRYGVRSLQAELEDAKGYNTRDMKAD